MNGFHLILGRRRGWLRVCLAAVCLSLGAPRQALCQDELDAKQMVAELRVAVATDRLARVQRRIRKLHALGAAALPAIQEAMPDCTANQASVLILVLRDIPGTEVTQYLVELAAQPMDSDVALPALSAVESRPIDILLTEEQIGALLAVVDKAHVYNAVDAAYVLSRCEHNDKAPFAQPIVDRFITEIAEPTKDGVGAVVMRASCLSPRVHVLWQFQKSFGELGDKGIGPLKAGIEKATTGEMRQWLTLALGMCGESAVAQTLENWVKNHPDPYFRAVAVRGYARAAGQDAVPLLKELLTDTFESIYNRHPTGPVYPIRDAARRELVRLGHPPPPRER